MSNTLWDQLINLLITKLNAHDGGGFDEDDEDDLKELSGGFNTIEATQSKKWDIKDETGQLIDLRNKEAYLFKDFPAYKTANEDEWDAIECVKGKLSIPQSNLLFLTYLYHLSSDESKTIKKALQAVDQKLTVNGISISDNASIESKYTDLECV